MDEIEQILARIPNQAILEDLWSTLATPRMFKDKGTRCAKHEAYWVMQMPSTSGHLVSLYIKNLIEEEKDNFGRNRRNTV